MISSKYLHYDKVYSFNPAMQYCAEQYVKCINRGDLQGASHNYQKLEALCEMFDYPIEKIMQKIA